MTLLQQSAAAVLLVLITLCLQGGVSAALIIWIRSIPRETEGVRVFRCAALVMQTTVAVILLHGIVILLWASCYRCLCLPSWESAFYFSASSYATVGYGDVMLPSKWRLLGPLESMVGMLMSGVSIGLLFAAVTHLVDSEPRSHLLVGSEPVTADRISGQRRRGCHSDPSRSKVIP
ncbi:MAG TPA: potassium channel family protein [Terriglobales bacterium]|nr:potassium channel family protein [Terriglobales bacterium]